MDAIYVFRKQAGGSVSSDAGRYIGITNGIPEKRLKAHLSESRNLKKTSKRINWLRSLDGAPEMEVLEWVPPMHREERERYWISLFRDYGHELVNSTSGGQGCTWLFAHPLAGKPRDPEAVRKSAAARRGKKLSPEHVEAICAGNLGVSRGKGVPKSKASRLKRWLSRLKSGPSVKSSTGLKGVSWCKTHDKFVAQIEINTKGITLGRFNAKEEAGVARDIAVFSTGVFGSYLNYPPAQVSATTNRVPTLLKNEL